MSKLESTSREDFDDQLTKNGYDVKDFDVDEKLNYEDPSSFKNATITVKRNSTGITKVYMSSPGTNWIIEDFLPDLQNDVYGNL